MRVDKTRSVVHWWDLEGPEQARLTVAWLDENNREMTWAIRGLHAYYIAQCFRARDATIDGLKAEVLRLEGESRHWCDQATKLAEDCMRADERAALATHEVTRLREALAKADATTKEPG